MDLIKALYCLTTFNTPHYRTASSPGFLCFAHTLPATCPLIVTAPFALPCKTLDFFTTGLLYILFPLAEMSIHASVFLFTGWITAPEDSSLPPPLWKFPGQGSTPCHSSDLAHCSDNTRSLSAEPQENSMKVVLYYFYHYCRAYQHCVLVSYVCVFLFPLDFGFLKSKAVICSYLHFHTSRHFQHVEV